MDHPHDLDTEKFIEEIRKRPAIWDYSTDEYADRDLRQKSWDDIVHVFGEENLDAAEKRELGLMLLKKWKNLRTCFSRELKRRKKMPSGYTNNRRSEYIYFKKLKFLQKVVTTRDSTEQEEVDQVENFEVDEELDDRPCSSSYSDERPNKIKKKSKPKTDDRCDIFVEAMNNLVAQREQCQPVEEDEDRMFLLSLLSSLKGVPSYRKMETKIKILSVLNEASVPSVDFTVDVKRL